MISKADEKMIKEALGKLCAHPLFVNSIVYTRLLRYLVEKAIQKEDIKEYTIGADLFGKNYLSDKNDGTVRTHMYKLRKKLAVCYADKNRQNDIIFEIKKGQYNLDFISKKEFNQQKPSATLQIPFKYLKISCLVLLFVLISVSGVRNYLQHPPQVWNGFLEKGANNVVVISDQYIIMATNEYGEKHATMYGEINSNEELLAYKKEYPDHKIDNTDYTLMSKMAPFGIKKLDEWFLGWNSNFRLQLESNLTLTDIKENNILFIGQFKTMNLSKSFFLKNSKVFSIYGDGFKCSDKGQEKIYNTQFVENGKVEYALVSFTTLSPGKSALYFVSNNDIGVMATLRNFTDKDWLKTFSAKLPDNGNKFNALFEVSGLQRTDMSCKLVELEIVD
jgi:hypothetical protein